MTTRKHAFYGILVLVSLLGLGITQSANASAYYTFIGTVNGHIYNPFVPGFDISFEDPFTGFASYDPSMGSFYDFGVNFFAEDTSNGFTWAGSDFLGDCCPPAFSQVNGFEIDIPDGYAYGTFVFGGVVFLLDTAPSGSRGGFFEFFGNSSNGTIESVEGRITSFQAVSDAGNSATLLGISLVAIMILQRKRRGRSYL